MPVSECHRRMQVPQALRASSHVNKLLLSKQGQQSDRDWEDMSRALRSSAPSFKAGKNLWTFPSVSSTYHHPTLTTLNTYCYCWEPCGCRWTKKANGGPYTQSRGQPHIVMEMVQDVSNSTWKCSWSWSRTQKLSLPLWLLTWALELLGGDCYFSSGAQSCPTLCDPVNRSTPGLPVHHKPLEFTQTRVHQVGDAIQPSHPLSSPSPLAPNPSQHQGLFQWVNSLHEVAKVLELQRQSFQWTPRTDLL